MTLPGKYAYPVYGRYVRIRCICVSGVRTYPVYLCIQRTYACGVFAYPMYARNVQVMFVDEDVSETPVKLLRNIAFNSLVLGKKFLHLQNICKVE